MAQQSTSKSKTLLTKNAVSAEATTGLSLVGGSGILADAVASLPVYDEKGTLLGYMALFDTPTLV